MTERTQPLRKRIAQLEPEVRTLRKQAQAQRQKIADKYGQEILALIDGDANTRVTVTDIVQKLVFQEEGNTISEIDSSLVGKIIEVQFNSVH